MTLACILLGLLIANLMALSRSHRVWAQACCAIDDAHRASREVAELHAALLRDAGIQAADLEAKGQALLRFSALWRVGLQEEAIAVIEEAGICREVTLQ